MKNDDDLKAAVEFHGHLCFGLSVGLKASRIALEVLELEKAKGEELLVIAENNSCAVDAIQSAAGATLGRGSLIIKDYGKHAYTFAPRKGKGAIRLSLRYDAFKNLPNREMRIEKILGSKGSEVFNIEEVEIKLPPEAEVVKSVQCSSCHEPVMKSKTKNLAGKVYCQPCYEKVYIQS